MLTCGFKVIQKKKWRRHSFKSSLAELRIISKTKTVGTSFITLRPKINAYWLYFTIFSNWTLKTAIITYRKD